MAQWVISRWCVHPKTAEDIQHLGFQSPLKQKLCYHLRIHCRASTRYLWSYCDYSLEWLLHSVGSTFCQLCQGNAGERRTHYDHRGCLHMQVNRIYSNVTSFKAHLLTNLPEYSTTCSNLSYKGTLSINQSIKIYVYVYLELFVRTLA